MADEMADDNNTTNKSTSILPDFEEVNPPSQPQSSTPLVGSDLLPWVVEFRIVGTADILRAPMAETLLLGRKDAERNIFPEIDLTQHNAQELGVSRLHARLTVRDNRITIEDMGSANGTYLNNEAVYRGFPRRIQNGDLLRLGNLSLQVHFIIKPSMNEQTQYGIESNLRIPKVAGGQHLLVLDDNEEVCQVIKYIGERSGFKVTYVHTLSEAIAYMDEKPVDGLILELVLSDGDGLHMLQYLRQSGRRLPVIAMSSAAGGFVEGQALQYGAEYTLTKPIAADELVNCLGQVAEHLGVDLDVDAP